MSDNKDNILEMDFSEYREYIERKKKEEEQKRINETKNETIHIWHFLLNIREYIQSSSSITREGQYVYGDYAPERRLTLHMENGDKYILIMRNYFRIITPFNDAAFRLIKTSHNSNNRCEALISFLDLENNDNPLNMKPKDVKMFIQYVDDFCDEYSKRASYSGK